MKQPKPLSIGILLTVGALTGCRREHSVVREASWTCVSEYYPSSDANIQTVEFRYTDDPRQFEVVPGMFLCDDLQRSSSKVVELRFVTRSGSFAWKAGSQLDTINGREYQAVGGWEHSGFGEDTGRSR